MANNLTATEVLARQRAVNPYLETIRQQIISSAGAGLLGTDRVANIPTQSESAKPKPFDEMIREVLAGKPFFQSRMLTRVEMDLSDAADLGVAYHPDALCLPSSPALDIGPESKPQPTAPYGIPGQPASTAQAEPLNTTELEKARPALPYFTEQQKRAKFDPFAGYVVDKMDINHPSDPWPGNNHPLQRIAAERSPLHGSAWLVID